MKETAEALMEKFKDGINNEELANYLAEFSKVFNQLVNEAVLKKLQTGKFDVESILKQPDFQSLMSKGVSVDPAALMEKQMQFMQKHVELWQQTALSLFGQQDNTPEKLVTPSRSDRRFKDEEWDSSPLFSHLEQAYLLNSQFLEDMADTLEFQDSQTEKQVKFFLRQFTSSLAPTNFAATNPQVCREILETKGANLYQGLKNFLEDLQNSPEGGLTVKMVESDAFTVGKDVASSKGSVVFQNEFMQLIQYVPTTEQVYERPLLITPPFINKYYILDLTEKNSFIKWLTEQGFTVFIISWANPGKSMQDKNFEDYMLGGPVAAQKAIQEITGQEKVNTIAYCIGGTLTACTQAYLIRNKMTPFASTTYMTTLIDFSKPGDLGAYISEEFISAIESDPLKKGVFDGRVAGLTFSMLRENDLYWSFFINNYLMGKDPAPFDLLYWNSDATNMPVTLASFYLRNCYLDNKLIEKDGVTLANTPIDFGVINTPAYFVSAESDHIALWDGTYPGAKAHGGKTRFVLSGSGHIAGIVNPPAANKYGYRTNDDLPDTPAEWLEGAEQHEGSWWNDWLKWVRPKSGKKIEARQIGSETYPALENAPGSYVMVRAENAE